jgi:hypothetical protein
MPWMHSISTSFMAHLSKGPSGSEDRVGHGYLLCEQSGVVYEAFKPSPRADPKSQPRPKTFM